MAANKGLHIVKVEKDGQAMQLFFTCYIAAYDAAKALQKLGYKAPCPDWPVAIESTADAAMATVAAFFRS